MKKVSILLSLFFLTQLLGAEIVLRDDFEGTEVDPSRWEFVEGCRVNLGKLEMFNSQSAVSLLSKAAYSPRVRMKVLFQLNQTSVDFIISLGGRNFLFSREGKIICYGKIDKQQEIGSYEADEDYLVEIAIDGEISSRFSLNGQEKYIEGDNLSISNIRALLLCYPGGKALVDWVEIEVNYLPLKKTSWGQIKQQFK
jgi:hypothetical protein